MDDETSVKCDVCGLKIDLENDIYMSESEHVGYYCASCSADYSAWMAHQ